MPPKHTQRQTRQHHAPNVVQHSACLGRSSNSKPHKKCVNCWRADRRKPQGVSANTVEPIITQIGAVSSVTYPTSIISKNSLNRHRGQITLASSSRYLGEPKLDQKLSSGRLPIVEQWPACGAFSNTLRAGSQNQNLRVLVWSLEPLIKTGLTLVGPLRR